MQIGLGTQVVEFGVGGTHSVREESSSRIVGWNVCHAYVHQSLSKVEAMT